MPAALLAFVVVIVVLALQARTTKRSSTGTDQAGGVLRPGAAAPAVVLPATTGKPVDLSSYRGRRNVLLYFYEHAG